MIYISTLIEKNYTKRLSFINTNQLDIIEEKGGIIVNLNSMDCRLEEQKKKVIQEYRLHLNSNCNWEYIHPKGKYQPIEYFSQKFVEKHSALAMVFQIHKLCFAKIKYFENNVDDFIPYSYSFKSGFERCEMHKVQFLYHIYSHYMIGIAELQDIKDIDEFKKLCNYLESFKN